MVYYFTSTVVDPSGFIYVGKDKFESKSTTRAGYQTSLSSEMMRKCGGR